MYKMASNQANTHLTNGKKLQHFMTTLNYCIMQKKLNNETFAFYHFLKIMALVQEKLLFF